MQDFTGVPAVVDLAAMRDAMARDGRRSGRDQPARARRARDRPLGPGRRLRHARRLPRQRRARVRAKPASATLPALGPGSVRRLLGRAARHRASSTRSTSSTSRASSSRSEGSGSQPAQAYPDTLVGTDSHTTMVNGLGVLGWGVGGIEAEAAMLGQPMSMLIPQVLGFELHGELPEGATATDLVLTVTEMLRERGVVGHVRRVLRRRRRRRCRSPTARRSATCRRSSARPARSSRSTPRRCATWSSPGARREQIELVEAYARRAGAVARRALRAADVLRHDRARPRRRSCRASPAQAAPGPGRAERRPGGVPRARCAATCRRRRRADDAHDEAVARVLSRPRDPPANGAPGHAARRRDRRRRRRARRRRCGDARAHAAPPTPVDARRRDASSSTTATS